MLNEQPDRAQTMDLAQLQPIIKLSHGAPGVLLDPHALQQIEQIYLARSSVSSKPAPKLKIRKIKLKAKLKTKPKGPAIAELNADHRQALGMSQDSLERIIKWSDQVYYRPEDGAPEPDMLQDKVYDYIKDLYNKRRLGTNDRTETMKSISSDTGVGAVATRGPRRERDSKLPVPLRSLDNLFKDEGDTEKWSMSHPGPYVLSAKMDGTSALYHKGKLYTRGEATIGRDITHVIPYLNLPVIPDEYAVRGEIVIGKRLFDTKYKGKKGKGTSVRKVNRNSVSGGIGSINHIDPEFLGDLTFAAYELIEMKESMQAQPSQAFQVLKEMGFHLAFNQGASTIDDQSLSTLYHKLLNEYEFDIDGLVVHTDLPYRRETKKNPDYIKAFKEALLEDIKISHITDIEWNPSQYGYLIPTAIYEPVTIGGGPTLERATLHNAREVVNKGIGPGAKVEIIYWGKVNPRIHRVLEPVDPYLPTIPYEWVDNGKEPANIRAVDPSSDPTLARSIQVQQIYRFLVGVGAKGIGEVTVGKIYDTGHTTVGDFINLKPADIAFLGPNNPGKLVKSIKNAMEKITVPKLMAGSKIFGRGLGSRKFAWIVKSHPEFVTDRMTRDEYIALFRGVDGFGQKTAELAANGMEQYWEFVDTQIPGDIYERIIDNTLALCDDEAPTEAQDAHPDIVGKRFYLTGFREPKINDFISTNGGTVGEFSNSTTDVLIRRDGYTNKKTEKATQNPKIQVIEKSEFVSRFLET